MSAAAETAERDGSPPDDRILESGPAPHAERDRSGPAPDQSAGRVDSNPALVRTPELREQAIGRWRGILTALGIDEGVLDRRHHPCPSCGGTDRFRYVGTDDGHWICTGCSPPEAGGDGVTLLQAVHGWDFAETARRVRGVMGEAAIERQSSPSTDRRRARMNAIWSEASCLARGDVSVAYLHRRGLTGLSSLCDVRTHPSLAYFDGDRLAGHYPAMVALVKDSDGSPCTLHVTWLDGHGGKAPVTPARKIQPPAAPFSGGAVRLLPLDGPRLLIGEGIETVLSARQMSPDPDPIPAWACLSAGTLSKFVPPAEVEHVVIAADMDRPSHAGEAAAYTAAHRIAMTGRTVEVVVPKAPGDFNDELLAWLRHVC